MLFFFCKAGRGARPLGSDWPGAGDTEDPYLLEGDDQDGALI